MRLIPPIEMIFAFCLFALSLSWPAIAQETDAPLDPARLTSTPMHAVTMHGSPKYGPDFTHFDYVNPDAPKGGVLRQHVVGSFDSLNPFIVKGSSAAGMAYAGAGVLYESLMDQSYDEPFSMYGLLAESIEMGDDNSWVAFNLRPEARWADGEPVTAHDVVWTFNALIEHGLPFFKAYYGDVDQVTAVNDRRVIFTFKHNGNAELPLILSQLSILPKHYWTAEGRDFGATTLEPPLGSGPYEIADVDPGRSITYQRRDDWWGKNLPLHKGRYNFDQLRYEYYRDSNVALEAFFAGEYDVRLENTAKLWATSYDAPAVDRGDIVREEIPHARPQGMQAFIYNIRKPIFQDREVRRALTYAFDFEWSNKQFAFGSYTRSDSFFENSELAARGLPSGKELEILEEYRDQLPPELFTVPYTVPHTDGSGRNRQNLRKAAEILEDAGWVLGEDGVRTQKENGERLEFTIVESNPVFERWVMPFIQNLEKIGVKANFRVVDSAQYQNLMNEFDFDMTILPLGQSSSPGNEQRDYWSSAKADMPGSKNYIGIKNEVVDALVERVIRAESREDLVANVRALDRVLLWGYYVIPQWHIGYWRIAWWDKLAHPETLSPITPAITDTWWIEE